LQICYTWIWDELLSKYVDAMVEHKTFGEICALREALEDAIRECRVKDQLVRAKDEQARAKDEHIAALHAEIASVKAKIEETRSSLSTFKLLFWGLLLICLVRVASSNNI
jgi:hypothetical protein